MCGTALLRTKAENGVVERPGHRLAIGWMRPWRYRSCPNGPNDRRGRYASHRFARRSFRDFTRLKERTVEARRPATAISRYGHDQAHTDHVLCLTSWRSGTTGRAAQLHPSPDHCPALRSDPPPPMAVPRTRKARWAGQPHEDQRTRVAFPARAGRPTASPVPCSSSPVAYSSIRPRT